MAKKKAPVAATKTAAVISDGRPSRQAKVVEVVEQPHAVLYSDKLAASVAKPTSSTSPIFKLSAEIRVKIWRMVVISDYHIHFRASTVQRLRKARLRSSINPIPPQSRIKSARATASTRVPHTCNSSFAMAMTCRQVYLETTPIYYSGNTFHIPFKFGKENSRTFSALIGTIGKENAYQISKIFIGDTLNNPAYVFDQLPGLRTLDIDGWGTSAIFLRKLKKLCQGDRDLIVRYEGETVDFATRTPE